MKQFAIKLSTLLIVLMVTTPMLLSGQNKGGNTCSAAFALTVSPTSGCQNRIENENTTIALPAVINPPCDNAGINRDLWYSFVAPANGEIALMVNLKTAFRVEGAIFESCPTVGGNNIPIYCNNTGLSGQIVKGLTPGDTYYLELWSDDFATGTFDLCLAETTQLGNQDDCSTPIFLEVYNTNDGCAPVPATYVANNFGATNDPNLPIPSCGSYGQGKDVWYAAVVPPSGKIHAEVGDAGGPNDWVMAAYSGDCGSLSEIDCNDDSNNFFPALDLTGLTPGDTIRFRIWEYGGDGEGPFTLAFTDPFIYAPDNDNCSGAQELLLVNTDAGCILYRGCGSSLGAHPSSAPTPSCGIFDGARDLWYSVVVPNGGDLNITLYQNQPAGNHSWSVAAYSGHCGMMGILGCAQGDALSHPSLSLAGLSAGDTILIRVSDNGNAPAGNFFICAKTSSSLALDFVSNTAYALASSNMIEWTYYSEDGRELFEVQRSKDAIHWSVIGTVGAHSSSEYHFEDKTPIDPMCYYRIRAISSDESTTHSGVMTVLRSSGQIEDKLFPNPVEHILTLRADLQHFGEEIQTQIISLNGQVLMENRHKIISNALLSIDVSPLAKQHSYILRVRGNLDSKSYLFYK